MKSKITLFFTMHNIEAAPFNFQNALLSRVTNTEVICFALTPSFAAEAVFYESAERKNTQHRSSTFQFSKRTTFVGYQHRSDLLALTSSFAAEAVFMKARSENVVLF